MGLRGGNAVPNLILGALKRFKGIQGCVCVPVYVCMSGCLGVCVCVCIRLCLSDLCHWTSFLLPIVLSLLEFFDAEGNDIDLNFGGLWGRGVQKQDPPIERDLYLSLEDLFFGCTKKIKISRRVSTSLAPLFLFFFFNF